MALGEDVELPGRETFRLRRPDDMFRKMHRELRYFREAGEDRHRLTDHALNFAMTAWHYTDWVWIQHEERLKGAGVAGSLRSFQAYTRRRSKAVAVCDVIANAVKHGGSAYEREDRPKVNTILVAGAVDPTLPDVELFAAMEKRSWSLKISIDGKPSHAYSVFSMAVGYWHRFRGLYLEQNAP